MLVGRRVCTKYSVVGQEGLEGFGRTEKYDATRNETNADRHG